MDLSPVDTLGRPLRSLRLSVTDRCNLRCQYCMPEKSYKWLERESLLNFEELTRVVAIAKSLGVNRLRITGGEPLLRKDLPQLVDRFQSLDLDEIAITTNGVLLSTFHEALRQSGISRFTVSLDALDPQLFKNLTQRDELERALAGLEAVAHSPGLKIDTVLMKGINESQIVPLLEKAEALGAEIRFIEYMDVGGATKWSRSLVYSEEELLEFLAKEFGSLKSLPGRGSAPAARYQLPSGQIFGSIASTTKPFCRACDRARITADGQFIRCLYSKTGFDLRAKLRAGLSDQEIREYLAGLWGSRDERGAELRGSLETRGVLAKATELQENVHLEMHTRGG